MLVLHRPSFLILGFWLQISFGLGFLTFPLDFGFWNVGMMGYLLDDTAQICTVKAAFRKSVGQLSKNLRGIRAEVFGVSCLQNVSIWNLWIQDLEFWTLMHFGFWNCVLEFGGVAFCRSCESQEIVWQSLNMAFGCFWILVGFLLPLIEPHMCKLSCTMHDEREEQSSFASSCLLGHDPWMESGNMMQ